MRNNHYIKANAEARMPHHILVVDTEAKINRENGTQQQTFRLGYAIYLRWNSESSKWIESEHMLRTLDDWFLLLDSLNEPNRKLSVFAHNASYDYTILMMDTYMAERGFVIDSQVIDSEFLVNAFKRIDGQYCSITFADTMNYYKMSLEKLGEIFADNKMSKPDFENVSDYELMTYCRQDTRVLATVMKEHIKFLKLHDLGNFKWTIAGQSFGAFRHRFMNEKILVHTYENVLNMELASYRGGRCEVFQMGKHDDIYKLDINSMYPYIMRENQFPNQLISNDTVMADLDAVNDLIESGTYVLADCDIKLNQPAIAVKKEKLFFPIGCISQTLTSPEIKLLLDDPTLGEIIKIRNCATYTQANLFRSYVDYFYDLRKSAPNKAVEEICKVMLNSLYGKFGQRAFSKCVEVDDPELTKEIFDEMNDCGTNMMDYLDHKVTRYKRNGNKLYRLDESLDTLAYDSCPVVSSTVTAMARNLLWSMIQKAEIPNVLYMDTDSLFVTETGYDNLKSEISQTELGKLKGVKRNAEKLGPNRYKQSQFITKNMRYRNGTPDGIVIVKDIIKNI
ncbi:MAG: hypothetical protein MUP60_02430, partial [Candidatus Thorarchaeota archaeon]|nr:hypothetical protein [Candidatus Thorarchaeota archaeon]